MFITSALHLDNQFTKQIKHTTVTHTMSMHIAITSVYTQCTSQYPIACSLTNAMHKTSYAPYELTLAITFKFIGDT